MGQGGISEVQTGILGYVHEDIRLAGRCYMAAWRDISDIQGQLNEDMMPET